MKWRKHSTTHSLPSPCRYHSHPVFEPRPSQKDMENQRNYQALFRDSNANEPFVGLIIGPYDVAMLGPASAITGELSSA